MYPKNGDGLIVEADNTLLGEKVQVKADMVVLATGMVPVTKDDAVVNLAYRQGPGFRDNALFDDYADSNFICFPYETQRTGIYAAGGIRRSHDGGRIHRRCIRSGLKSHPVPGIG